MRQLAGRQGMKMQANALLPSMPCVRIVPFNISLFFVGNVFQNCVDIISLFSVNLSTKIL